MIRRLAAAGAALAVLALAACSPTEEEPSPTQTETSTAAPADPVEPRDSVVYDQELTWERCGELECATIQVPLDWSDPNGETIDLALNRAQATDPGSRQGSILINPGGPGGSGLDFTEYFTVTYGDAMAAAYDVVGFDPRGVGSSTPVECGDGSTLDAYYVTDFPSETQDDLDAWVERTATFAQGCADVSGAIVENVDTVSAARDMDVIRALVGDEKLNYLGFSYGTQLGATYASLYPETVGRMVLDGAVDFLLPDIEQAEGQAAGFEQALTAFLEWCGDQGTCPLSSDIDRARGQIGTIARTALEDPYPTGNGGEVNGNLMVYGIVVTLYSEESWPYLEYALQEVLDSGTAAVFMELANFYLDRDSASGEYLTNSTVAFTAISCLDGDDEEWTLADQQEFAAAMEEASPTFGWWFASGGGCAGWPWTAGEKVESLDYPDDASTIVVIGTTRDPATPYGWAESLTERLGNAVLVTYDGDGHTAYGRSNQCIIDSVDAYFVDGAVPDSGLVC